jgi:DNA repair protein SbcC/Rad50
MCGMRRGRGQPTREDRAFADRHRPWHGSGWRVTAVVSLDDGRVIEIDQGLGRGSRSIATDKATRTNVTTDLEQDGSVDAATLLGLSRETALATLFVRQADMLRVLSDAGELQEYLERAAATSAADATADEALAGIAAYKRERVGLLRAGARGPLAIVSRQLDDARAALDQAEERFESYQQLLAGKHAAEIELSAADDEFRHIQAHERERDRRERWQRIVATERRVRQARSLENELATGPQDIGPSKELVASVTRAVMAYEARPSDSPELEGPTADELKQELLETPEPPADDIEPSETVTAGLDAWRAAAQRLVAHDEHQPTGTAVSDLPAPATELRRLADDLQAPMPEIDQGLVQEIERRRAPPAGAPRHMAGPPSPPPPTGGAARSAASRAIIAAAAGLILLGVVLAALGQVIVGGVAILLGVTVGVIRPIFVARRRRGRPLPSLGYIPPPPRPPDAELPRLEARLLFQEEASAQTRGRRDAAVARVAQLGLPVDPMRLRALAADAESLDVAHARYADWLDRRNQLATEILSTSEQLRAALVSRGVSVTREDDLEDAFGRYLAECRERAEVARRAARRPDLKARLTSRQAAEAAREQDLAARATAGRQLLDAAQAAGCTAPTPDGLVLSLREWLRSTEQQDETRQRQAQARARLDQLLDGRTVDELEAEIAQLISVGGERPPEDTPVLKDRSADLRRLESRASDLRERVAELTGQVEGAEKHLIDVSPAIEAEARAEAEARRLTCLADDLDFAAHILESAQHKVHADIAPVLNETIRPWVPRITQGRYDDVRVDPATLEIEAHEVGGQFRSATVLSHGTTEQLFLLLRLALAKHLATTGESAPVVLDDVSVQSDTQRTTAILELLHDLSSKRQVVLFSQEDEVLRWADETLNAQSDRLIRLKGPAA